MKIQIIFIILFSSFISCNTNSAPQNKYAIVDDTIQLDSITNEINDTIIYLILFLFAYPTQTICF